MYKGFEWFWVVEGVLRSIVGFHLRHSELGWRGKDVTGAVKGELVRWTSSSKLVDTRPFRAFIIISIFSFIVCISCAMRRLPTRKDDWYLASPIYSWHCFPLGHPSLDGFSFRDNFCHVCPYSTRRFDRFAPDHSTTPTVIPTHGSIEWAIQLLRLGFVLASPMHWAGSWFLGWWWPLIAFGPYNSLSLKRRCSLSLVPIDDANWWCTKIISELIVHTRTHGCT